MVTEQTATRITSRRLAWTYGLIGLVVCCLGAWIYRANGLSALWPGEHEVRYGRWHLSGRSSIIDSSIGIEVYDNAGRLVESVGAKPEADGVVSVWLQAPTGPYTIVKTPGGRPALREIIAKNVSPGRDLDGVDFTPKLGDLNRDNYISPEEIKFVAQHLGQRAENGGLDGPYFLLDADFDHDGVVTAKDLAAAAPNVNRRGDDFPEK